MAHNTRSTKEVQGASTTGGSGGQQTSNPGTIGFMREFSINEDFEIWYEQFQEYVAANLMQEERSISLFLTLMGGEGYKLVRNLCVPQKPKEKTLEECVTLIKGHLNPKPNMIAERFKFKKRSRVQSESVSVSERQSKGSISTRIDQ